MWTKLEMMICRRNSELFKIHSQTLHHKLPLLHFPSHWQTILAPSQIFQFNSTKPINNYESFLNRKLKFFTWAHILSSWCEEIDWYERSLSINMSATQRKQLVNISRPDIYCWWKSSIWSSFNNESSKSMRFQYNKYFWNPRMIDL